MMSYSALQWIAFLVLFLLVFSASLGLVSGGG